MNGTLRAEWTKLRTVPSTAWLLLGVVAATVAMSTVYVESAGTSDCPPADCVVDTTKLSLSGVMAGQAVVAVLALLTITNEYSTRTICATLTAVPRRITVLLGKAGVLTTVVLAAGTAGVAGALLAGRLILPGEGFSAANGYPPLSLADEPTLRAALGSVLYLGLIALLSFGLGAIIRDTAAAVTIVLSVLYLAPLVAMLVSDQQWQERLQRFTPSSAGLAIQQTIQHDAVPIGPWAGLGVLAAYAGAAVLVGGVLFTRRDA